MAKTRPKHRRVAHPYHWCRLTFEPLECRLLLSVDPMLVRDINVRPAPSSPRELVDVDGTLFFTASDGLTGRELWKSDGTDEGTVLVKDILPGVSNSAPSNLTSVGGTLFFTVDDGVTGVELWKSDGT